ncbi:dihydroorotate dehydrogenase [Aurantimonas sp. A2-1-M11]|uniref:dihydroorotate dehydrogenase n=1 Tax=Aurantimonas sp. A2-1-M11 TaxID=3113712 RepID=UPI002F94A1CD
MVDLSIDCGGLRLANPVMPAAGTFGHELGQAIPLSRLGALVTKTITPGKRLGNPTPRVAEDASGMLNSIGIPSKGAEHFIAEAIPLYAAIGVPLVVSLSADTVPGFADLCRAVSIPGIAAVEVNISCPNIEDDGRAFAMRPETTLRVMEALRAATDLPLWAKLTPNTGEIREVARAAEDGGADALVVANTILAMSVDLASRRPTLGNVMGGLSGPAVKPIILRMAYQCVRSVDIPVIGCGGIATADDALEYMLVGCPAVQVGTATFLHPGAMLDVIDGIERYCEAHGVLSVGEIVGGLREPVISDGAAWEAST